MVDDAVKEVTELLAQLSNKSTREKALSGFSSIGPEHCQAVPLLLQALENEQCPDRWAIARALGWIGAPAGSSVPALAHCLNSEDSSLCQHAALALGLVGNCDETIVQKLKHILDNEPTHLVAAAASSLLLLSPSQKAIQVLDSIIRSPAELTVRWWAICGLCDAVRTVPDVLPSVILLLRERPDDIMEYAAASLATCEPSAVIPSLLEALRQEDQELRCGALFAICELGSCAQSFRAQVAETLLAIKAFDELAGTSEEVRRRAALVTGAIPLDVPEIIDGVLSLLEDSSDWVQECAANAVRKLPRESVGSEGRRRAAQVIREQRSG